MKESKRNARNKKTLTEEKNASEGLISRQDKAEEGISQLEDLSIES